MKFENSILKQLTIISGTGKGSGKSHLANQLYYGTPAGFGKINFPGIRAVKKDLERLTKPEFEGSAVIIEQLASEQLNEFLSLKQLPQLLVYRPVVLVLMGDLDDADMTAALRWPGLTIQIIHTTRVKTVMEVTPSKP